MKNHPMGFHGLMGTTGYTSHFYGQTTPIIRPMGMSTGSPIAIPRTRMSNRYPAFKREGCIAIAHPSSRDRC